MGRTKHRKKVYIIIFVRLWYFFSAEFVQSTHIQIHTIRHSFWNAFHTIKWCCFWTCENMRKILSECTCLYSLSQSDYYYISFPLTPCVSLGRSLFLLLKDHFRLLSTQQIYDTLRPIIFFPCIKQPSSQNTKWYDTKNHLQYCGAINLIRSKWKHLQGISKYLSKCVFQNTILVTHIILGREIFSESKTLF